MLEILVVFVVFSTAIYLGTHIDYPNEDEIARLLCENKKES